MNDKHVSSLFSAYLAGMKRVSTGGYSNSCNNPGLWFDRLQSILGRFVMAGRDTSTVDVHVGHRVRSARLAKGISQETLGAALGVSFQQVQKYEKGLNRIGTGRLHAIAKVLGLPLPYFFEGLDGGSKKLAPSAEMVAITKALSTTEGVRIAVALASIQNPKLRRRVAELLEEIIANEIQEVRSLTG